MDASAAGAMEDYLEQVKKASLNKRRVSCHGHKHDGGRISIGGGLRRGNTTDTGHSGGMLGGVLREESVRSRVREDAFRTEFLRRVMDLQVFVLTSLETEGSRRPASPMQTMLEESEGADVGDPVGEVRVKKAISFANDIESVPSERAAARASDAEDKTAGEPPPPPPSLGGLQGLPPAAKKAPGDDAPVHESEVESHASDTIDDAPSRQVSTPGKASARSSTGVGMSTSRDRRAKQVEEVIATVTPAPERQASMARIMHSKRRCVKQMLGLEIVSTLAIVANCVIIGMSSDLEPEWMGWTAIDGVFALVFTIEMIAKIVIQRSAYVFGPDRAWNFVEAALVAISLIELFMIVIIDSGTTTGLGIFRILRLSRISRLLRLGRMQIFTELMIMVQGALGGVRTLCWAAVLMALPLYAASILFRETLGYNYQKGGGAEGFATVPEAFFTLFRCVVSSDCNDRDGKPIFALVAENHGFGYSVAYYALDMLMSFGLFNVIIAIFIENVLAGARRNDLVLQRERLRDRQFFAMKMAELAGHLYQTTMAMNGMEDPTLPPVEELMEVCAEMRFTAEILDETFNLPQVRVLLEDLNIAEEDTMNMFRLLDIEGNGDVDMAVLFEGIANLRGSPGKSDLVMLNFVVEQVYEKLRDQLAVSQAMYDMIMMQAGNAATVVSSST